MKMMFLIQFSEEGIEQKTDFYNLNHQIRYRMI